MVLARVGVVVVVVVVTHRTAHAHLVRSSWNSADFPSQRKMRKKVPRRTDLQWSLRTHVTIIAKCSCSNLNTCAGEVRVWVQ